MSCTLCFTWAICTSSLLSQSKDAPTSARRGEAALEGAPRCSGASAVGERARCWSRSARSAAAVVCCCCASGGSDGAVLRASACAGRCGAASCAGEAAGTAAPLGVGAAAAPGGRDSRLRSHCSAWGGVPRWGMSSSDDEDAWAGGTGNSPSRRTASSSSLARSRACPASPCTRGPGGGEAAGWGAARALAAISLRRWTIAACRSLCSTARFAAACRRSASRFFMATSRTRWRTTSSEAGDSLGRGGPLGSSARPQSAHAGEGCGPGLGGLRDSPRACRMPRREG